MSIFGRNMFLLTLIIPLSMGCSKTESTNRSQVNAEDKKQTLPSNEQSEDDFPVITFGGATESHSQGKISASDTEEIISRLKDLQILLGTWRGITRKTYGGFKAVDQTEWVWDFQTDSQRPALVMTSSKSPYYRNARLTYLPSIKKYHLVVVDTNGKPSTCLGAFSVPIEDNYGDDKTLQRSFKLELTQTDAGENKATRYVFNQKNNNRYLLEYYRQHGADDQFLRIDTVSTQREGTSFALVDEGYGEKTCIISGGLGTSTVTHAGKTYSVCCSGCKSAFEEDPERWIARAEKQKKK